MTDSVLTPVTLVVKAPSQKISDVSIDCDLGWSVNRLKQHLSQVYPGKPVSKIYRLPYMCSTKRHS